MSKSSRQKIACRVRGVEPEDVRDVWKLLRGLAIYEKLTETLTGTPETLHKALFGSGPRAEALVAEREGRFVGYALFFPVFSSFRSRWRLWLEDLYVAEDARGTGAGVALMSELARIARQRGWASIDWEVLDWNRSSIHFYEQLGSARVAQDLLRYRLDGNALEALANQASDPTAT
ncbi:MAG TPA: GNAT family N-acetyltransferase [Candidatus Eisenbacteria bacterium]|nr:GNAT family N-acetyltransferase [Candidatus Eisenbacteria bacterium]